MGRPAGYIPELDHGPHDLHEFVRHGLIYPIEDESRDVRLNSDSMLRFYNEPGWLNVLRHFANFDEDEAIIAARVAANMRELVAESRK